MKTFTTYAEKKAKQFLNLLQGYTKGIRITAILILLLMGVNNAWAVDHTGGYVYFLKPSTWTESKVMMFIGHDSYTSVYEMTKVSNTDNLYSYTMPSWGGANYVAFANAGSVWGSGSWGSSNRTNAPHYTNVYKDYGFNSGSYYIIVPASTSNNANITINYKSSAANLNLTTKAIASNKAHGTVSVSGYYMSNATTASTRSAVSSTSSNATASTTLAPGSTATFKATASTGYEFVGWYDAATGGNQLSTSTTYTYKYDISYTGKTVYGRFKAKEYTITYKDKGDATFSGTHESGYPTTHTYGTATTLKTATKTGYTFVGWFTTSDCSGTAVTSLGATTYTANITLYAKWTSNEETKYNVTAVADPTAGGTVTPATTTLMGVNSGGSITATPNEGYEFTKWSLKSGYGYFGATGTNSSSTTANTIFRPTQACTIKATFTEINRTITIKSDNENQGTVSPTSVTAGIATGSANITATPKTGYKFVKWTASSGITLDNANSATTKITKATADGTVTATFEETKYTVAIKSNNDTYGTVSPASVSVGQHTASSEISATPKKGRRFVNWTATTGISIANPNSEQTTITATAAGTLTANFELLPPTPVILKPNDQWKQDNARYAIYYWGEGNTNGWVEMTDLGCSGEYFTGEVPAGYLDFKFVRLNPDGKTDAAKNNGLDWYYKWNETENLTTPAADKNMYDMTSTTITHLYLKPNEWSAANAWFATYLCNGSEAASWHKMTILKDYDNNKEDIYSVEIGSDKLVPSKNRNIIFVRKNPSNTGLNWNDVWNQTADLNMPTDGSNFFSLNNGDWSNGTWSTIWDNSKWTTYTVPTYTININAPEAGSIAVTVDGNTTTVTNTPKQITNIAAGSTFTVAYTPSTGFKLGHSEINGTKEEYTGAGTYTVCGPVDITAHFITASDQVVYLRPNDNWLADNALFYAYAFNRYGDNEWIELTTKETDYTGAFGGTIPAGYSDVIFVRLNPNGTDNSNNKLNFNNAWNQTIDYVIPINTTKNAPPMSAMSSGDDYVISINTTNNRFIIGEKVTSGSDKDKYQGSWEASDTPIYGIPGDWQGTETWAADEYPLMGPDGLVTVNITQTNDTLGFKVYHYPYGSDQNSRQWLGNNGTMVRGGEAVHEGGWTMETNTDNCGLGVDVAGDYVFAFNIRDKKLTVTYPEIPAPTTSIVNEQRVFEDEVLAYGWVAGEGTEANPYQLYADEAARITLSPIPAVEGLTAYYQFGNNEEQTSNVFDWKYISSQATTMEVKAYYKNAMGAKSAEATINTSYFKTLALPFYLMTQPKDEINIDRIAAGANITVQFRSDTKATVDLYLNDTEGTPLTTITDKDSYDFEYDVPNDTVPCILTFIAKAQGAGHHGRIFEVKADVAIYKNVIIKVNDPEGWVKNVYMWRDYSDAVLTPWPGDPVLQNYGTWRVFSVKYPYYDRFIINDGNTGGSKQTIDWVLPADDTCYELLDPENNGSDKAEDKGKYGLKEADCPGNLMVNNIKDTTLMEGEQIVVMPEVFVGLGYKLSDVEITHLNADNQSSVLVMQSGNNIIVSGYGIGTSNVTVSFTLGAETITKTFTVTVVKNTHITIQVKVPVNFGDGNNYQWKDGTKIGIRYWGAGINGTDLTMDYAYTDATYHYAQAQLPLGTDDKINFHFYYESHSDENAKWRQSSNVTATVSGCYKLAQGNDYYRSATRDDDYCFDDTDYAQYQVKVFLPIAGKEYSSNVVTNTIDTLSFFAPGQNETGYRAGTVQLYKNGKMVAAINPTMFAESNVYTATVNETGDGLGNVAPYSGNFYIRTYGTSYKNVGFNNGKGWNSIKDLTAVEKDSVRFTYFIPRENEFYNHYWVQAMNTGEQFEGKDVSACVANEYNDDLAGKLTKGKGTDEEGDIKVGTNTVINVRFGYDPRTNYFGRAIIQGSEYNDYLNIHCDNAYKDKNCSTKLPYGTSGLDNKMQDISNWVYQRDFYVPITNSHPSASLYVEAKLPSNNPNTKVYDHLLGYVINEVTGEESNTPVQRTVIGSGTNNGTYLMRVVYDFKTNRIIAAWLPQGTIEVTDDRTLHADVLFVRKENNEVPQIQLANDGKIRSLESMYFALELERGDTDKNNRHQEQYWFTLPFDCVVGSISGVPGYMQTWGIQRYRGDLRAQKGWFIETPTFWEWLDLDDVMHAGEGYLLVFDKKAAPWEEIEVDKYDAEGHIMQDANGNNLKEKISMMRLYFPSMTVGFDMQQQSDHLTRTYENHPCTITLHDRDKQDSNWKVIGTTSYNNAGINTYSKGTGYEEWKPEQDTVHVDVPDNYEGWSAPMFRYSYRYEWQDGEFNYWYTPEDGQGATYKSFFGYMVQFAGTINWQPIMSETVPEGIAARRRVAEGERTSYTTRLELANANGEKQDQAFVALDEKATTTFDQNKDLNKIINAGKANIYTLSENIPFAGNTLPIAKATVPVGVVITETGEYTFRMPDGTDGISAILVDNQTGAHTNMLLDEYTVILEAGTYENRFSLVLDPQRTSTEVENIGDGYDDGVNGNGTEGIKKYIIDGQLFIRTANGLFDAKGQRM